ncbi:transposase [Danaus plexippus plexippus]|uniref:Transposase n=1 Tax=Danaus plexippus plexippus TaxID=278856 RepID=A0A212EZ71_DANPL|nr:transposase [Danaus plexippus plexippus]
MPVEAWNAVESLTLTRAWNKLLKLSPSANPATNPQEDCFEEITEAVKILSIGEGCDEENIKEWLDCDSEDPGFQILSDEEIVDDLNGCENEEKEETETEDECQGPSHAEAFEALEIAFKWFERQEESDSLQLLQLKRIRDLAMFDFPDDGSEDGFESDEAEEFNVNIIQRLLEAAIDSSNLLQNSPAHLNSTPNNCSKSSTSTIALCSQLDNSQLEEPLIVQSSSPLELELTDESECEDDSWGKDFWTSRPDTDEFDKYLYEKKFYATGTVKRNGRNKRLKLKKGEFKWRTKKDVAFTVWQDTKEVLLLTTAFHPRVEVTSVQRTQKNGTREPVHCPMIVKEYTKRMGGVDRFD